MSPNAQAFTILAVAVACLVGGPSGAVAARIVYTAEHDTTSATDIAVSDGMQNGSFLNDVIVNNDARFGDHAYGFGGGTAYPDVIDLAGSANLGSTFTLATFAKTPSTSFQRFFSSYSGTGPVASHELIFDFDPDNNAAYGIGLRLFVNGVMDIATLPAAANDGQYHHYAATYDHGAVALYFDGQSLGAFSAGSGAVTLGHNLRFGEDLNGGTQANEQFVGNADDITVWDSALSASRIGDLAAHGANAALVHPVPTPATWAMGLLGFGGILLGARRRGCV